MAPQHGEIVERWTKDSGIRIRFLDNAPESPTGLPIVFSPGMTDFADEYVEMLQFFAPRQMIVIEVRGRGRSEIPTSGYRSVDHARDLKAAVAQAGFEQFHLMTFSRGTTWALDMMLEIPERVISLSIGDYWAREHAIAEEYSATFMATRFRGKAMKDRIDPTVVKQIFANSVDRDLLEDVVNTKIPLLLAIGSLEGCLVDEAYVRTLRERLPNAVVAQIPNSSHDIFKADRLAFPRLVSDFIIRHE